jgi:hypothetical protein
LAFDYALTLLLMRRAGLGLRGLLLFRAMMPDGATDSRAGNAVVARQVPDHCAGRCAGKTTRLRAAGQRKCQRE